VIKFNTYLEAELYNTLVWSTLKAENPEGDKSTRWADVIERNGSFYITLHERFIPEGAVIEQLPAIEGAD